MTDHSFSISLQLWASWVHVMAWWRGCSNVNLSIIDLFFLVTFHVLCLSSSWIPSTSNVKITAVEAQVHLYKSSSGEQALSLSAESASVNSTVWLDLTGDPVLFLSVKVRDKPIQPSHDLLQFLFSSSLTSFCSHFIHSVAALLFHCKWKKHMFSRKKTCSAS